MNNQLNLVTDQPLRAPQKFTQAIRKNQPFCSWDTKSVAPASRVCEFPNENLTVSVGKKTYHVGLLLLKKCYLHVQPSSAAAEGVFAGLFSRCFAC